MSTEHGPWYEEAAQVNTNEQPLPVGWLRSWAVVQDLCPFGYKINRTLPLAFLARLAAGSSHYLTVMRTEDALAYNARSANDAEFFDRELDAYVERRGLSSEGGQVEGLAPDVGAQIEEFPPS